MIRRHPFAVTAAAGAVLLAACGSGDDPTLDTSAAPDETAADMPGEAAGDAADQVSCEPTAITLAVVADDTRWNTDCLAVTAGQTFSISLDNKDDAVHNLAILASHSATDVVFRGELTQGPKQITYEVPALAAGTYAFHCEVHPTAMRGTFIVK